ncbi:MAG: DUF4232 domain-containing protein [Cryobacterium sp.]|nr:DUF4232 domain-containing protein [Micrococcales bacterium]MBX3078125.1 DUF4232 domain-containing protein [Cryobacterium sp.]MBX3309435.1 DUF4232 domain-containing protein [Cryobacterium sp.]MCB1282386.1 DUF4232 domain-containing protein [Salinibacterium sp.]
MNVRIGFLLLPVAFGLALAGCASGTSGGPVATLSSASTPEATATPTPSSATSPPEATAPCTLNADGVDISYLAGDGSAGHFHGTLVFTNVGSHSCLLEGFPIVYFGNPEVAGPIGARSSANGSPTGPVVLAPSGGAAVSEVTITNAAVTGVCDPLETSKLLVRLPDAPDIPYSDGIGWARSVPINPMPACLDESIGLIVVGSIDVG